MNIRLLAFELIMCAATIFAASADVRQLPKPALDSNVSLKTALEKRGSNRTFNGGAIDGQTISNLLWCANGVNRADSGKLVVPAALAKYAISLYVMDANGIWKHDRANNTLNRVADKNLLKQAEGRGTLAVASGFAILLVADYNTFDGIPMPKESAIAMIGVEAGAICQDIYLYCAASSLNAVCCGSLDRDAIAAALKLPASSVPFLSMVIGK